MEAAIFPRERFASGYYPSTGAYSLRSATNGVPLGEYREGDVFMPILLKDADKDSISLE